MRNGREIKRGLIFLGKNINFELVKIDFLVRALVLHGLSFLLLS